MANETITVFESDGTTETDVKVLDFGRQAAAASKSLATCTEDKAVLDAIAASLSVVDDWDETNRAAVNPISGQAGITGGAGAADAATVRVTIDTGQVGSLGQATAANSVSTTPASDRQNSIVFDVTLSTDTAAYASGDLIADTQQLDAFFNKADGKGVINSITIIDEEAQNVKFYLLFHSTSTSMGTENGAPNISDANASAGIQGIITVETTDWITVSGTSVATIKNIGLPVKAVSGTDDLYISCLNATGAPDWDADSLKVRIGALLD
jgi:hypothetical protein